MGLAPINSTMGGLLFIYKKVSHSEIINGPELGAPFEMF